MKKTKAEKGITLIALIITIVVLLILAVVAIKAVQGDGIIAKAKSAQSKYTKAQAEEEIKLALSEWKMVENTNPSKTFIEFMEEKFGADKVTANGENEVTVTLSNGKQYEAKVDGTVDETIAVGSYVEYNVEYTDMYSGITYNKENGWRYLGKDDDGNYLIVSTAIPGILYYNYETTSKPNWWATAAEVKADNGIYNTSASWNYDNNGYPNKYAAYGLRYKFERIPFVYQASGTSVSTKNTGIFRKVGSITSGNLSSTAFRASGVNIVDVHNLTLAELNRATNSASGSTREDADTTQGFKDLTGSANGLFDMQDLMNGYTNGYSYHLSSPYVGYRNCVYCVHGTMENIYNAGNSNIR